MVQVDKKTGEMKAVGNGIAKVVAIATDGTNKFAECTVEATVLVEDFYLHYGHVTMFNNQYFNQGWTWWPANAKNPELSWWSEDINLVTVDRGIVYSAYSNWWGNTYVWAKTTDGTNIQKCFEVVVEYQSVTGASLNVTDLTMSVGHGYQLNGYIYPAEATNNYVEWYSSNSNVATVNSGFVRAVGSGVCAITMRSLESGHTATCYVRVNAIPSQNKKVTGVSLNESTRNLEVKKSFTLSATVSPNNASNKGVIWKSSDTSIATVDGGKVTAKNKTGIATITTTTKDGGYKATCKVTVVKTAPTNVSVTGVELNTYSKTVTKGDSFTLTATVSPKNATNNGVSWSSNNEAVVTVNSKGEVKAKGYGQGTITVKTNSGEKTAKCIVKVQRKYTLYSHGSIIHSDQEQYPIYVNTGEVTLKATQNWTLVAKHKNSNFHFDWGKFIIGLEFEGGSKLGMDDKVTQVANDIITPNLAGYSIFMGFLSNAGESMSRVNVEASLYKSDKGNRNAVIKAGSSQMDDLIQKFNVPRKSAWSLMGGNSLEYLYLKAAAKKGYETLTGKKAERDCEVLFTVDSWHQDDDGMISYLWVNAGGNIMETSIRYPEDKIEILHKGNLFAKDEYVNLPISWGSIPVNSEYKGLLSNICDDNGMKLR